MLCTPVNFTIGNSWLIAVFAFPDFLLADLLQLSIYIYMKLSMHYLKYWKLMVDCCLCISWFNLHVHICSYLFTLTLLSMLPCELNNWKLLHDFCLCISWPMHPCELNNWKLFIDCCLCISWFSPGKPYAVIHLHLHVHICSYPFTFTWCYPWTLWT